MCVCPFVNVLHFIYLCIYLFTVVVSGCGEYGGDGDGGGCTVVVVVVVVSSGGGGGVAIFQFFPISFLFLLLQTV